jgi:hypothetical protein
MPSVVLLSVVLLSVVLLSVVLLSVVGLSVVAPNIYYFLFHFCLSLSSINHREKFGATTKLRAAVT